MRVAHVCTVAESARRLLLPTLRALASAGHEVEVVSSPGRDLEAVRAAGFPVHGVPIPRRVSPLGDLAALARLVRLFRRERYDAVHTHTSKAGLLGRLAARLAGVPLVLHTYHGLSFSRHDPLPVRIACAALERLGGTLTDFAFSQGLEDLRWLERRRVLPADRLRWIGNGVDTAAVAAAAGDARATRRSLGIPEGAPLAAFAGRLDPVKGPEVLLEAWGRVRRALPAARLILAGDGSLRGRLAAAAHPFGDGVRLLGRREDVPRLLRAADLVVLPSRKEGVPRVLLEGMCLGRPFVASDIPGVRELADGSGAGALVPCGDAAALAAALVRLLADPGLRARMGRRGRTAALERWDESLALRRLLEGYAALPELGGARRFLASLRRRVASA